jgi:hypothetical protein
MIVPVIVIALYPEAMKERLLPSIDGVVMAAMLNARYMGAANPIWPTFFS